MLKKALFAGVAALALAGVAIAQVNTVPQVGLITSILKRASYSASTIDLALAATPTDAICISGSATKSIVLRRISITGTAGTLITTDVALIRRDTADTGGTPAATTANPANTVTRRDTNDPTSTATLVSYTANPTLTDAGTKIIAASEFTMPTSAAGTVIHPIVWDFDTLFTFVRGVVLRGTAQQACINFNGGAITSGNITATIDWTEE